MAPVSTDSVSLEEVRDCHIYGDCFVSCLLEGHQDRVIIMLGN